jgi:hypothetical protein
MATQRGSKIAVLEKIPLFAGLSQRELDKVSRFTQETQCLPDTASQRSEKRAGYRIVAPREWSAALKAAGSTTPARRHTSSSPACRNT